MGGSEAIQSLTRFSSGYFGFKKWIQKWLKMKNGRNGCWRFLDKAWAGDSDLMEWRNRNALDMTLRMYCGLFVTVLQVVWMMLIDSGFVSDFGHREWKYLLVLLAEFIYFGSLW